MDTLVDHIDAYLADCTVLVIVLLGAGSIVAGDVL